MDNSLVIIFDNELQAYEGSRALQELQDEGSLNLFALFAKAVIIRGASGKVIVRVYDLTHLKVSQVLLTEVEGSLQPGKAAVVAEVWEEDTLPVDIRMEALGGVVFRRTRREVLEAHIERDLTALKASLNELESECDQTTGKARARLQKQVDAARVRLQAAKENDKEMTRL
jgi:hypothetical protein